MSIRPLRDWIVVRRLEYKHELLEVVGIKLAKGEVVAVGAGRRLRRKMRYLNNPDRPSDGYMYFADGPETGKIRPMQISVGDVVEFSERNAKEFEHNGEMLLMVPEQSCYARDPSKSRSDGVWSQKSAGLDKDGRLPA